MLFDFLNGLLLEAFNLNKGVRQIVFSSFLERTNFHIPESDLNKPFIYFRKAFKQLFFVIKMKDKVVNLVNEKNLHFHNAEQGREMWLAFLNDNFFGSINKSFSLRNLPLAFNIIQRSILVMLILLSIPFYYIIVIKKPKTKQNMLLLPELMMNLYGLRDLTNHDIFYTGVYEPESNVFSYYLTRNSNKVDFFISGTPLTRYLTKTYCHIFYLSNAYQKEELSLYQDTISVKNSIVLPPLSFNTLNYYSKDVLNGTVAVYTSGIWKRKEKKVFFDPVIERKEEQLFNFLDRYISSNPGILIMIFMHPVEKQTKEDFEKAKQVYLAGINHKNSFSFAEPNLKTVSNFDMAEIAVTTISNTLFERLYAGYKTIIINDEHDWFPFSGSSLQHITFNNYDSFKKLLDDSLRSTSPDFFAANTLNSFTREGIFNSGIIIPTEC